MKKRIILRRRCFFLLLLFATLNWKSPLHAQGLTFEGIDGYKVMVSEPAMPSESVAVSSLQHREIGEPGFFLKEVNPRQTGSEALAVTEGLEKITDPLIQEAGLRSLALRTPNPILNFNGMASNGSIPLDPVGAVGPNHYVQMVNATFAIYDKNGNELAAPTNINKLWSGQGNACETQNDGDPVVLYDRLANRWLLSQFALPNGSVIPPFYMCIAVSKTSDPMGAYYLYAFKITDAFPDYPKLAVWPDAYYMSSNDGSTSAGNFTVGAYAFDRINMLNGKAGVYQKFEVQGNFMLPAVLDSAAPPPPGSPNYFYTMMDDKFWPANGFPGSARLELWEFKADFLTSSNAAFTKKQTLPITVFNYTVCGYFNFSCIPQPSPGENLDAISEWPMWRLQYRNFGTYETLAGNFTVDADGTGHAGIRWFELRRTGGSWTLYQEGTHSPDANNRWVGSIAMDGDGNMALGYSVSGSKLKPEIRYATRLASDPLGTLQKEVVIATGGGVQNSTYHRWGDYSSMSVDPADDCTFWYTNAYVDPNSNLPRTKISAFKMPECIGSATAYTVTASSGAGGTISPTTAQTVSYGSTTAFTVMPNTGYTIASVGGTCGGTLGGMTYTTNAITANCTVIANFVSKCSYTLTPASKAFTSMKGFVLVNVTATGDNCTLNPAESYDWISAALSGKFTQNATTKKWSGKVKVDVTENKSSVNRTGTVDINGKAFTLTQNGAPCIVTISPTTTTSPLAGAGATGSFTVKAPDGCNWTAASANTTWLTITSGSSGSGNGTVNYAATENTTTKNRTGKINIATGNKKSKKVFTAVQNKK